MRKTRKIITLFLIVGILFSTFIPMNIYAEPIEKGVVTANSVRFRKQPKVESGNIIAEFNSGTKLLILGTASKGNGCTEVWYHAEHNGTQGYICSDYVKKTDIPTANINTSFEEQLNEFPASYHPYLIKLNRDYPTWKFLPLKTNLDFEKVVASQSVVGTSLIQGPEGYRSTLGGSYNYTTDKFLIKEGRDWYAANSEVVAYYLDPRNFLNETNIFMFESLTYNAEVQTKEVVDGVLNSDFLKQYSDIFTNAASEYNISPIHLAARVRQEVGSNGSVSTDGRSFEYNGQSYSGLYNFFNIGASTSPNPVLKGLIYANGGETGNSLLTSYGRPWTSPEKAIMGGASFLVNSYISKGQTTLYLQKYNVNPESSYSLHTHQYMTNVKAPQSESLSVANGYVSLDLEDEPFIFTIPVFDNMPSETTLPSSGNPNNYLKNLLINGQPIAEFNNETLDYRIPISSITSSIFISGNSINNKTKVEGLGEILISKGETNHQIKVIAENGSTRLFNLKFEVVSELPITVDDIIRNIGVKNDEHYLSGIGLGTNLSSVKDDIRKVYALTQTTVKDNNDNLKENGAFSTGDKLIIDSGNDSKTFTIIIKGDINSDGGIDLFDLLKIQKHLLGSTLKDEYFRAADINGDGKVDILDLLLVQKHLLKDKIII